MWCRLLSSCDIREPGVEWWPQSKKRGSAWTGTMSIYAKGAPRQAGQQSASFSPGSSSPSVAVDETKLGSAEIALLTCIAGSLVVALALVGVVVQATKRDRPQRVGDGNPRVTRRLTFEEGQAYPPVGTWPEP